MKTILYLSVIALSFQATAQTEEDALRYSQNYFGGSAKNNATAGALTAIGGDFSTTSQNPSSMARFNKNNFLFTPTLITTSSNSDFYGNSNRESSTEMKIGNVSYLKSYKLAPEKYSGWMSIQMGAGYNRINSFENKNKYSGELDSSILDYFTSSANGTSPDNINYYFPYTAGLAYETYAIDPDTLNSYTSGVTSGNTIHNRKVYSSGSMGEFSLAMSGNYKNKLYIGGTINAVNVNYRTNFIHNEEYTAKDSLDLNGIKYTGYLETQGWGFNGKLGLTYLATPQFSLGFAFHTPTLYKLTDNWGNDMVSNTDKGKLVIADENKQSGRYKYNLVTPIKTVLSAGYIIKKKGSIGAEVEVINYNDAKLSSIKNGDAYYSFTTENSQIKNIYQTRFNYKIGGEYRVNPSFYLRGGYAYYSSPYTEESNVNTSATQFITAGAGLNFGEFYFDFAVVSKHLSYDYYAYNPQLKGSKASFSDTALNFSASIGIRF
jgi:hypothetical protein